MVWVVKGQSWNNILLNYLTESLKGKKCIIPLYIHVYVWDKLIWKLSSDIVSEQYTYS